MGFVAVTGSLWLLGGVDPTGGAGVTRDRWAAATYAPSLPVAMVTTVETEQGDGRPARLGVVNPERFAAELAALPTPAAIKLGLVPAEVIDALVPALDRAQAPIVMDPVIWASDGGRLGATVQHLVALAKHVRLVTPNRREALALLGEREPSSPEAWLDVEQALVDLLEPTAVLLKDPGGHRSDRVCDVLRVGGARWRYERSRQPGPDPRGTGCALATAIACELAGGATLWDACERAIEWLDHARRRTAVGPDGRAHLTG